jgi:N4-gp56 family major capsid protein
MLLVGRMSQQRVPYSMRDAAKTGLANWWKDMMDVGLLNQLAGNTAQTNVAYTGLQAPVAPDADHWILAGGAANEAALTSADVFSVDLIPAIVAKAQGELIFPIKPVLIKGIEVAGVLFLTAQQVRDLKTNYTQGEWGDIYRAALQGGQVTGNPIFTGAIGMINNVVLHQDTRCPWGDSSQNMVLDPLSGTMVAAPTCLGAPAAGTTNVGRAVFVGAQAAALACGADKAQSGEALKVNWYEELLDAGNQLRITAGMIWGLKKTRFNNQDFGTIVVSTWNAPS